MLILFLMGLFWVAIFNPIWVAIINPICSEELITDGRTSMVSSHQTFQRNSYVRRRFGSNSDRWRVSLDCWHQAAQFCAFWGLSTHLSSFVAVLIFPVFPGLGSFTCCCLVAQSYPTLCDLTDCSLKVSLVRGISQARILEWVATSFSRGSSSPRDQTHVSSLAGRFFITEPLGKPNKAILNALFIQSNAVIIWWKIELRQHWWIRILSWIMKNMVCIDRYKKEGHFR